MSLHVPARRMLPTLLLAGVAGCAPTTVDDVVIVGADGGVGGTPDGPDLPVDAAPSPDAPPGIHCAVSDATWLPTTSRYLVLGGASRAVFLDANGGLISDRPYSDYPGLVAVCGPSTANCQIDAIVPRTATGLQVIARGQIWTIDQDLGNPSAAQPLTAISGLAAGPCAGVVGTCHVEGVAWREQFQQYLVVARGIVYTLDANGALVTSSPISAFPGIAQGPCLLQSGTCQLDAVISRPPVIQVIAKDSLYNIDNLTGALTGSAPLTSFSGLTGVCQ